jgi:hypothetical protein
MGQWTTTQMGIKAFFLSPKMIFSMKTMIITSTSRTEMSFQGPSLQTEYAKAYKDSKHTGTGSLQMDWSWITMLVSGS